MYDIRTTHYINMRYYYSYDICNVHSDEIKLRQFVI